MINIWKKKIPHFGNDWQSMPKACMLIQMQTYSKFGQGQLNNSLTRRNFPYTFKTTK